VPPLPLDGVRVVDTTDERGEMCGRILADLGAEVVRVEPPGGAPSRRVPPWHGDRGLFFALRNLNKSSVGLDPDSPADATAWRALLGEADIWVESSRPGRAPAGMDPVAVAREVPGLVVVSVTDFGHTGPYRDHAGSDPVLVALSGMLFRAGVPELPPVLPPGNLAYDVAGVMAAFAALTGLWHRLRRGTGAHIDLSVMEACAQTTDWGLTSYSFIRQFGAYAEIRNGGGPIYNVYPCKDGYVRASVVTKREWHRIREWLGDPEFLMDPHWDTGAARIEARDVLEPLYRELFARYTKIELSMEGQRRGLGITPLLEPSDVLVAEHFARRGSFRAGPVIDGLAGPVPDGFLTIDGARAGVRSPAPEAADRAPTFSWAPRAPLPDPVPAPRPVVGGDRAPAGASAPPRPFAGIRVLDFGVAGATPEIARLLAEYGAESIRVESRLRPDLFRVIQGGEMSAVFASSNRSKQSFGVDFATSEGQDLVLELVRQADVVVENLPPGTMERLGLSWSDLSAVNSGLVMLSSQLMGRGGPWEDWRGYGANTQPVGGLTHLWSFPDTGPVGANVAFPDHVVGRLGTVAVLAGLLRRARTGAGGYIEIAQVETVLNLLGDLYLKEALEPGSVRPRGNESDRGFPWGVYPCAGEQRWCVITCRDDHDWAALVKALGSPPWATAPGLADEAGRRARAADVESHLAEWTSRRTDREVMEVLQGQGVPAGMMMYMSDEPEDPHLQARGYLREVDQTGLGPVLFEGPAFRSAAIPDVDLFPAPLLGEHTREICRDLLGMDDERVGALISRGVLFQPLEAPAG
jgi:crotonobetainyl-CoA:carnitine CoA-transferase CaiB-like acyl-CoA transferase